MYACELGNEACASSLLRGKANWNIVENDGWNAMMLAARNAHTGILRVLYQSGANVTVATEPRKVTALHSAAYNCHLHAAKFLLDKGADPNAGEKTVRHQ